MTQEIELNDFIKHAKLKAKQF